MMRMNMVQAVGTVLTLAFIVVVVVDQSINRHDNHDSVSITRFLRGLARVVVTNHHHHRHDNSKKSGRSSSSNLVLVEGGRKESCFGSLIHADMVLTAAQCLPFLNVDDTTVFIGYPDLSVPKTIELLIPHPSFDFPYYDFLLIKLKSPVAETTIPTTTINRDPTKPILGDNNKVHMITTRKQQQQQQLPHEARHVYIERTQMEILSQETCQQTYQPPIIHPLMICATTTIHANINSTTTSTTTTTSDHDGTCRNDAGSPLMLQDVGGGDDDNTLIGISSTGGGQGSCGNNSGTNKNRSQPGIIFSRVSWASDWIEKTICSTSAVPPVSCHQKATTAL